MCTALTLNNKNICLFGRNMDIQSPFGQQIVIVPRNYVLKLRFHEDIKPKYASIGMAFPIKDVENNNEEYPLFAEGANEKGLAIAGLNFPGTAYYPEPSMNENSFELAPFEVIPFFLSSFSSVQEVKEFLKNNNLNIVNKKFRNDLPVAPMHFIISDKQSHSIVIEPCKSGLKVYDNKLGILTNNPSFDWQMINLSFYQNLEPRQSNIVSWSGVDLKPFGQGFGSFGIPGDWTPPSRFVKTAYLKSYSTIEDNNEQLITQFFHILDNVSMVKGAIIVEDKEQDNYDITLYTSCIDLNNGVYYYKTYFNNQINSIKLFNEDLNSSEIITFQFSTKQSIFEVN